MNILVVNKRSYKRAKALAHGSYQEALIDGRARWSGADLRGVAKKFSGQYARSRNALLDRLATAGVPHCLERREHGRLVLTIGRWQSREQIRARRGKKAAIRAFDPSI